MQRELSRLAQKLAMRREPGKQPAACTMERIARARAYQAFTEAEGARAYFESWWTNVFASALATHEN